MAKPIRIDFVSDVVCPWCIIGLRGLEIALERLEGVVEPEIHFQPFELNPSMPYDGQNIDEHIGQKYGQTPEQTSVSRGRIRERAADLGFEMRTSPESRIYNSFDAHRLLHWAELEGRQAELKHALFGAYFTDGFNIADHEVLAVKAVEAGLDPDEARSVLGSNRYADEVRQAERVWQSSGINSVPAIVVNSQYLISGGQPPEVFEKSLREIAAAS